MKLRSILKWSALSAVAIALHGLLFALVATQTPEKERVEDIEIDLNMLEDTSTEDPNRSLAELEEERKQAEEKRLLEEQKKLEEERRLAEEQAAEKERLAEEQRMEAEKQEALEKERLEKLEEQRAEQKRLDAVAWKKKEALKKQQAAERARKQAAQKKKAAAAWKKKQAAKKAASAAYAKKQAAAKKAAQAKKKVKSASVRSRPKPTYPRSLLKKKITGVVKLKLYVSSSGRVERASLYKSSGHAAFDQSALRTAKRWKYTPAKNGLGMPITDTKIETIVFRIQ